MVPIKGGADWAILRWLLPLVCLHGLIYLALVPPWQHYDEPAHFEYARLIAERGEVTAAGVFDPAMRWQIVASMGRFRFWGDATPLFSATADPPLIGYDQHVHPPLYYLLIALPIRLTLSQPVEIQLFAARLVSVFLYTLSVAAVWRLSVVIAPDMPRTHMAMPLLYALVPPFAAIMTAVNNDVLVNFTGATLLLGCALLIRSGLSLPALSLTLLSVLVGVFAKRTALPFLPPLVLALFWAVARRPLRLRRWLLIAGVVLLGVAVVSLQLDSTGASPKLGLRPWVNALDASYLRLSLDPMMRSLTDWELSAQIYPELFWIAFSTYWAVYGWGHVPIGTGWVWALLILSGVASLSLGISMWRLAHVIPLWQQRIGWLFFAVIVSGFVALILRVHPMPAYGGYAYLPRGRYLFSGMPATAWVLTVGVLGLVPKAYEGYAVRALLAFMLVFEGAGLTRLVQYYYATPWPIAVLAAQKPGLLGLPPVYPVLLCLYLFFLIAFLRRIP